MHVNDVAGWWPGHRSPSRRSRCGARARPGGAPAPRRAADGLRRPRQRARDGGRRRLAALVDLAVRRRHHLPGPRDRCARRPLIPCRALWPSGSAAVSAPVSCGSSSGAGAPVGADALSPACHERPRGSPRLPRVRRRRAAGAAVRGELHALYRETATAYLAEEAGRRATARRLLELVAEHVPARTAPRRRLRARAAARRGADGAGTTTSASSSRARRRRTPATRSASRCTRSRSRTSTTTAASTSSSSRTSSSTWTTRSAPSRAARTCWRPGGVLCVVTPDPSSAPRGSPGGAGGATCPRTPACSRAGRCASCWSARGSSWRPTCRSCGRSRPAAGSAASRSASAGSRAPSTRSRGSVPAQGVAQPVARRRAGRPRAAGRRHDAPDAADVRPRRREVGPRRPARVPRRRDDPGGHGRDARRRRRPRAARRRREPGRHDRRRARARPGRAAPPGQPRLRRESEERLPARAARRRRRHRHGPRRRPVRPRARAGHGAADPRRRRRHGHRLAPARRPGDRRRHAALEVGRQPAAHRRRTGPSASGSRSTTPATGRSRPTCCGRSRSCATPTRFVFDQELFAQVIAHGARVAEIPIPTRYFHEASSVSFTTSVRYGLETLGVLARFTADRHGRSWTLLRRPAVDWPEPPVRSARPAA